MNKAFYLAAIPEPVTLLGLKLRPFSLGHNLLLHRIESGFVCGGSIGFDDLAASVFICAQTYQSALNSFQDSDRPAFMRTWHRKLTGDVWWRRLLRLKITAVDLRIKSAEFVKYLEAGSKMPYYEAPADKVGESQIETIHAVWLSLISETNLTNDEILNRPWGQCLYDYIGLKAMNGELKIMSDDKAEARRAAIAEAQAVAEAVAKKLQARMNGHL